MLIKSFKDNTLCSIVKEKVSKRSFNLPFLLLMIPWKERDDEPNPLVDTNDRPATKYTDAIY